MYSKKLHRCIVSANDTRNVLNSQKGGSLYVAEERLTLEPEAPNLLITTCVTLSNDSASLGTRFPNSEI